MVILEWSGEIGWELWQGKVKNDLKMSDGDITVRFSSVGGDIFEGADIINLLMDHKRDNPNVKMHLELKGVAASMGSAIASSPVWDSVAVESLTAYMIHRPSSFSFGDFDSMKQSAEFLEKATNVYAQYYSNKSGKSLKDIQSLMKDTTWYFGQEIVDNGFADRVIESEQEGDKNMILTSMKNKFATMSARMKELHKDESFDVVRASACFREEQPKMVKPVKPTDNTNIPSSEGKSIMEVSRMTEEELKKDNPELYNTLMKKGADNEREVNSARVKALTEMKNDKDYKDLPEIQEVLDNAIMGTDTVDSVLPKINIAVMKIMKDPARMAAIESPQAIQGGSTPVVVETEKLGEI